MTTTNPAGIADRLSSLQAILAIVNVEPIPNHAIDEYKKQEVRRRSSFWGNRLSTLQKMAKPDRYWVYPLIAFLALITTSICMRLVLSVWNTPLLVGGGFFFALSLGIGRGQHYLYHHAYVRVASWHREKLAEHRFPIPSFALRLMEKLRELGVNNFEIDALYQERKLVDPILYAIVGDQKIAIAVWDENGNEVKLT